MVGLALSACGSDERAAPAAAGDVDRVSFLPEEPEYPQALLVGTLGGDVTTGCLWVEGIDGERLALRLHSDTARLDVSARPPVVRDGDRELAAFGDAVELGGGSGVSPAAPECAQHGEPFTGHGLRRSLPGVAPTVTLTELRRVCGPTDGPALGGTLLVAGVPRQPLDVEIDGPDGTVLARAQIAAGEGATDLLVPLDDPFADTTSEWNVRVFERGQVLAQTVVDARPGPACG